MGGQKNDVSLITDQEGEDQGTHNLESQNLSRLLRREKPSAEGFEAIKTDNATLWLDKCQINA